MVTEDVELISHFGHFYLILFSQESLEQERLKLEEVVKMEIKARMAAVDAVSTPM
jgi:hypothetical protein